MSVIRDVTVQATDLACQLVGRRRVVRAARFVLWRARLDGPNDMACNGEESLQRWILGLSTPGEKVVVVDVGANTGQWSGRMLDTAGREGRDGDLDLHVFEPASYTYERLSETLAGHRASLYRAALSDTCGTERLQVVGPAAGTNSFHPGPSPPDGLETEEVPTTTLDSFAACAGLDHVALVKIDTEGHDLAVLGGARSLFAQQRVSCVQFEYNSRWIYARSFLRDAFQLLEPLGYVIGKLTLCGVEFYPHWDAELEAFVEGNYVACVPPVAAQLPSVTWWKDER
jgi:FkbM family methyltransferase